MSEMDDASDDTGSDFAMGRGQDVYQNPLPPAVGPYLEIVEQPQSRGFRFRYACEGKSHGGLQGVSSRREKKSHPTIKINRYKGPARIEVSLVTDEVAPRPHAHELIGRNCADGKCVTNMKGDGMSISFPNLGVRHVTKKSVQDILTKRYEELLKLDKQRIFCARQMMGLDQIVLTPEEKCQANQFASEQAKSIQLSVVRLCFTAFLQDQSGQILTVISNPIYDSKAPCTSLLKICRMDKVGGSCAGNEEVFLLCDKVQKDDIEVRFFEQDEDGDLKWEATGHFAPHDVHRQYAIVFRTPPYSNKTIERSVTVHVQLRRTSDNEVSDPKPFTYYPQQTDMEDIQKKRKKQIPNFGDDQVFPTGNGYHFNNQMTHQAGNGPFGSMHQFDASGNNGHTRHNFIYPTNVGNPMWTNFNQPPINMMMNESLKNPPLIPLTVVRLQTDSADSFHDRPGQPRSVQPRSVVPRSVEPRSVEPGSVEPRSVQPQFLHPDTTYSSKQSLEPRSVSDSNLISRGSAIRRMEDTFAGLESTLSTTTGKSSAQISEAGFNQDSKQPISTNSSKIKAVKSDNDVTQLEHGMSAVRLDVIKTAHNSEDIKTEISQTSKNEAVKQAEVSVKSELVTDDKTSALDVDIERNLNNRKLVRLQALASVFTCTLHGYAMTGDVKHLLYPSRRLIANQNDDGDNPIHLAVIHAQALALLNFLAVLATLPVPEAINDRNFLKQTPLYLSVITEQPDLVDILLKCGADCFTLDKQGNTLLHIASKSGFTSCLEKLLTKWLNNAASGVWHPCINSLNYEGFSALHLAVRHEQLDCVKMLLSLGGADVELRDGSSGRTALHHAVDVANLFIVVHLIVEAQADVNASRYDGNTALHLAVSENKLQIVSVLVAAGANTEAVNFDETDDSEDDDQTESDVELDGGEVMDMEDESNSQRVSGFTPKDLAQGNLEMLRMLNREDDERRTVDCEKFAETVRLEERSEKQFKSVCDSGIESIHMRSVPVTGSAAAVSSSTAAHSSRLFPASHLSSRDSSSSDLHKLDTVVRVRLAKQLDPVKPGSDWRELAQKLHLGSLVDVLQNSHSPSQAVLDNFEECGGTVSELRSALIQMKRNDAVDLLDRFST